jgi:hypothetical protein
MVLILFIWLILINLNFVVKEHDKVLCQLMALTCQLMVILCQLMVAATQRTSFANFSAALSSSKLFAESPETRTSW